MSDWPRNLTLRPIESWPGKMTKNRTWSQFKATLSVTTQQLEKELWHLNAKNPVLQIAMTEADFRNDGMPRAQARASHPGIILSMETPKGALSFPCDTYVTWQENLRAVVLTMERLRAIARYGVTQNDQQYKGWLAIEATAMPAGFVNSADAIAYLIGIVPTDELPYNAAANVKALLRAAQRATHPDSGGDSYRFQRVSAAETFLRAEGRL